MNITFQSWMQAVWMSLIEPAEMAARVLGMRFSREAMWLALALVAVLNVILLAVVQIVSPAPLIMQEQMIALSPFAYAAIIGSFLTFLVFMLVHAGRMVGGTGTLDGALMLIVWFQAISLTLETIQVGLLMISPGVAALFGMISLGAIIWVFVHFINVLHGFANFGKAIAVIVLALIATALGTGVVMGMLGISAPVGGTT